MAVNGKLLLGIDDTWYGSLLVCCLNLPSVVTFTYWIYETRARSLFFFIGQTDSHIFSVCNARPHRVGAGQQYQGEAVA